VNKASIDQVYIEIGQRIVAARKKKAMSQEQLASKSEIDRSHMGFIEQGRRRPTLSTLFKIAKALDVTLEGLFRGM
jgi:transcriptional regulator with XRE-family HTH domain